MAKRVKKDWVVEPRNPLAVRTRLNTRSGAFPDKKRRKLEKAARQDWE